MKTTGALLSEWAVKKIEAEMPQDVCLLLEHTSLDLKKDQDIKSVSFYIPATQKAHALARDFIIGGVGYDLFPMGWERIERMADMKDYNSTCLGVATIIYARSQQDRDRFEALRARQQANLANPAYMRERALEWQEIAEKNFAEMMLEDAPYKARMCAAYICDTLALSIALYNGQYFKHGQTDQLAELAAMKHVPDGFAALYRGVAYAKTIEDAFGLCRKMILIVKDLLAVPAVQEAPDYEGLKLWYQEMCYTWRRVYHFIDANDPVNAFIWCCFLQHEVNLMGKRNGVAVIDLYGAFDADDMTAFRERLAASERAFVEVIESHGATLESYDDIGAFLSGNPVHV